MVATPVADAAAPALSATVKTTLNVPGPLKTCEAVGDEEIVSGVPSPHCHVYETIQPFGDEEPAPSTSIGIPTRPA
jgi:hypothetical protein